MKILVINGPNLNMLGIREPNIYGKGTYADLVTAIEACAKRLGVTVTVMQSNYEGALVEAIQNAYFDGVDGIVINPAAYTHTSIALLDALKAVSIPAVEVHLSDVNNRDEFRKHSFVKAACEKTIAGKGFDGYIEAMEYLAAKQ